jgi:sugar lactone lactonase YvrE
VNDGKCDARGRFVSGTMDNEQRRGAAALYQLHVDGTLVELLPGVTLSNGLDWNQTGDRLYHVDTTTERVDAFDYDLDSGRIGERRPFADLRDAPGRPDGLTVDAEGGVWVAVARAGVVHRYDERGRLDAVIAFPTPIVTSCTFGGRDLRDLYVTSSRALLPEPQRAQDPVAGSVFVVEGLGVQGRPPNRYGGVVPAR